MNRTYGDFHRNTFLLRCGGRNVLHGKIDSNDVLTSVAELGVIA